MKYIRFRNREDMLHWNREFPKKGELTVLRGGIYLLTESQFNELAAASVDIDILSPEEVDSSPKEPHRESA